MQIHQVLDKCLLIISFKNILTVSPYQCFFGNSVSAYPIRIVSDTYRIRYLYPYPCNIDRHNTPLIIYDTSHPLFS